MKRALITFAAILAALSLAAASRSAVASAPADPGFVFGVVPQGPLGAEDIPLMRSGGIDSFRIFVNWSVIEPQQGKRDWSGLDSTVAAASVGGVAPLPFLYGTPTWAARADNQDCAGEACAAFAPRSDGTRLAFARFAAAAVERYGPGGKFWLAQAQLPYAPIRTWQIWNEQNSPTFFGPGPDVRSYAALLRVTADSIRAVDPAAEIILGGMWGAAAQRKHVMPATSYLRRLYREPGIEASFDSVAVHPYSKRLSGVFAQVEAVRAVVRQAGDGAAGLWVTELGWASGGPRGENLVATRPTQARLLQRAFAKLHRKRVSWRVRGAFWYAWRDTEGAEQICAWCARSGLHSVAGVAKPAWYSLSSLARQL